MKISKRTKLLIALISLLYSVSLIQSTYAKYVSSADATSEMNMSRWNILVNDQDIYNDSNFSSTITPVFEDNDNIRDGYLAPTAEGYFELTIDATNTDVSFDYSIDITPSDDNSVDDLSLYKYELNGATFSYEFSTIENTINYDALNKIITLKVYVKWIDDEGVETMDNDADTEAATNGVAQFDISVHFIQKH